MYWLRKLPAFSIKIIKSMECLGEGSWGELSPLFVGCGLQEEVSCVSILGPVPCELKAREDISPRTGGRAEALVLEVDLGLLPMGDVS